MADDGHDDDEVDDDDDGDETRYTIDFWFVWWPLLLPKNQPPTLVGLLYAVMWLSSSSSVASSEGT